MAPTMDSAKSEPCINSAAKFTGSAHPQFSVIGSHERQHAEYEDRLQNHIGMVLNPLIQRGELHFVSSSTCQQTIDEHSDDYWQRVQPPPVAQKKSRTPKDQVKHERQRRKGDD